MQITVKAVDTEWINGKNNSKYGKASVTFIRDGQEKKQTLVSFKNPDVFKKVQEVIGQTVEVETTKVGDFWEWKSIQVGSAGSTSSASANSNAGISRVTGSNYETKEERAARQTLIVRQSSLSNAVETLSVGAKTTPDPEAVLALAEKYTEWVFKKPEDKSGFDTIMEDVPY